MKKCISLFMFILLGCSSKHAPNRETEFVNEDFRVIYKSELSYGSGKHASHTQDIFVQRIEDTTYYAKLGASFLLKASGKQGGCGCGGSKGGSVDSLFYTKQRGDILHFDYINKSHFWRSESGFHPGN